jgi:hypothetical protein
MPGDRSQHTWDLETRKVEGAQADYESEIESDEEEARLVEDNPESFVEIPTVRSREE